MKFSIHSILVFITITLLLSTSKIYSQDLLDENIYRYSKFQIGMGHGSDYARNGIKLNIFVTPNLRVNMALGISFLAWTTVLPVVGVEFQYPNTKRSQVCPFVFANIGRDVPISEVHFDLEEWPTKWSTDRIGKIFSSGNVGVGIKIQPYKSSRIFFSTAVTYRIFDATNAKKIITSQFSSTHKNYSILFNSWGLSFGANYVIGVKSEEQN